MFQLQTFGIILFVQDSIFSLPFVSLLFLATRAELLVVKYRHKSRDKESPTKRKKVEHRLSSNSAAEDRQRVGQVHYGRNRKKHRQNSHPIIHCPTSEAVSEVSERAQRRARAKRAVQSKQTSERCERCERMSERTSEWPSTYVLIFD